MVIHSALGLLRPWLHPLWMGVLVAGSVLLGGPPAALAGDEGAEVSCGSDVGGRGQDKARWIAQGGGTEASERAVGLGLQWLAEHQLPDGGWSFDHARAPHCQGKCGNPGTLADARNAATALALLPFLGAGHTHQSGAYKEEVKRGLYFLVKNIKVTPQGGSLHGPGGSLHEPGGGMYSHAMGTIALCEAYAMTHDKGLYPPAQQAINFIADAQDPDGGGWGCEPRQPGDLSVTGWQVMALKAGHMAYLRVPPIAVRNASRFLDSVQADGGARYGYTQPAAAKPDATAVGLLLRMYLGWKRERPELKRGVEWLAELGPSRTNVNYNYWATQVMRHYGGDAWRDWNAQIREYLVRCQSQEGHETGSWYFDGQDDAALGAARGGRLRATAMATMILEVYYRYLPIYRKFPGS